MKKYVSQEQIDKFWQDYRKTVIAEGINEKNADWIDIAVCISFLRV